jgi:hypothetical protein
MNLKRAFLTCTFGLTLALLGVLSLALIAQAADPHSRITFPPFTPNTDFAGYQQNRPESIVPEPRLTPTDTASAQTALAQLPLRFIPNQGQTDPMVKFHVHSLGGSLFFSPKEVVFSLSAPMKDQESKGVGEQGREKITSTPIFNPKLKIENLKSVVRLTYEGANPRPTIEGLTPLPGGANFFLGNDPTQWQSNVPTYDGIVYRALYPGIDLVYRGTDGQLKSEFIVAPGADPDQIRLRYQGADSISIRSDGALVIQTDAGELVEAPLLIYQEVNGVHQEVEGRYLLLDNRNHPMVNSKRLVPGWGKSQNPLVGFQITAYDPTLSLIIDPELAFSTYLGSSQRDEGDSIAIDNAGNIYVTGYAGSSDFPTKQTLQDYQGLTDAYITQIIKVGGVYTYGFSTFLGGSNIEKGFKLVIDNQDNIYVTGDTDSNDFPTWKAIQADQPDRDIFITQLIRVAGVYTLGYSTYLGGSDLDMGVSLAVDDAGAAYITGQTSSTDFPTWKAIQDMYGGGSHDGFVTKIISAGGVYTFGYSTYLGGNGSDTGYDLAVDEGGNAYVTGATHSSDFPMRNAILGNQPNGDAFVTQIISTSGVYTYGFSTYLGGSELDFAWGIALDDNSNIYISGPTTSPNFPTWKAIQADQPSSDAFVTQIINAGGVYTYGYSTYLGGSSAEDSYGLTVDGVGNAYVVGGTTSTDFPTQSAVQDDYGGGFEDGFVTQIISTSGVYTYGYSTFLGGSDFDFIIDIAVDSIGTVYVVGNTISTDFPTQNASQGEHAGGSVDAFVAKISLTNPALTVAKTANVGTAQVGQTITYTYHVTNSGNITLTGLTANDNKLGSVALNFTTLTPGQITTGMLVYTVITADLPGPLTNTVVVTGLPSNDPAITGTASASVTLIPPDDGPATSIYLPVIIKNN